MVRNYRIKNRYFKGSKLSPDQTTALFRCFFVPLDIGAVAEATGISSRTVRERFAAIHERILSDAQCRSDLISYLSPELESLHWLSRHEDLSENSHLWERLRFCLFDCPAAFEPALAFRELPTLKGLQHMAVAQVHRGKVRSVRMKCAACPIGYIWRHTERALLQALPYYMKRDRRVTARQFHVSLFRFMFLIGVRLRAGKAKAEAASAETDKEYWRVLNANARDLAIIFARHTMAKPLNA